MSNKTAVAITRCAKYVPNEVQKAVRSAFELIGGVESFVLPGQKVLLKPNLLGAKPPAIAATTHPAIVEAVAKEVMNVGGIPVIGDSPPFRGQTEKTWRQLLEITEMQEVANRLEIQIVDFDFNWRETETSGKYFKKMPIANAFFEADVVINLPKLKTHGLTGFTGAIKNMFGCVPGLIKSRLHLQAADDRELFAQMLVDVFSVCKPNLNIMDGIVAMEGCGPGHGTPKEVGVVIAGIDAVAVDATACRVVGIEPDSIDMIRLANNDGLGTAKLEEITILGSFLEEVSIEDFQPSPTSGAGLSEIPRFLHGPLRRWFVPMPRVSKSKCTGCGDCAKVCAIEAMKVEKRRGRRVAFADLDKCIACYCCDEVCPSEAIDLRKSRLGEMLGKLTLSGFKWALQKHSRRIRY